ncbi:MAG: dihydroorotase family protein [Armatimonadetes bacterium]|nr:dihydroorotase family protein [Armatimonadota bacterium]
MATRALLLVRGARLVTAGGSFAADLAAHDGRFVHVGPVGSFDGVADATLDADGLTALPGLVDVHAHFREPGVHAHKGTYASESRAAAAGGVTCVLTMPNTNPFTNTVAQLEVVRECARRSVIDYGFHFMADGDNLAEMLAVRNVAAHKLYLNETTGITSPLADEARLRGLLATGLPFMAHAEGDTLNMLLAAHAQWGTGPLHIGHVALAREVEALRRARAAGQWVTAEASPHHLFLDETDAARLGPLGDMRPTLKTADDVTALWAGIADGTIDAVATDHAPHLLSDKQRVPAPPGVPGIQTMLPLLLDAAAAGRLSLADIARLTSRAPAAIFGLQGKGAVRVGQDADLVLVDPSAESTITNADQLTMPGWTPFDGRRVRGTVLRTLRRGEWIWADGAIQGEAGGVEVVVGR